VEIKAAAAASLPSSRAWSRDYFCGFFFGKADGKGSWRTFPFELAGWLTL
jgi:hypothetical protein